MIDTQERINKAFSEIISEAHFVDYDITVDENLNITLVYKNKSEAKNMPVITVETKQYTDTIWGFCPSLVFPKLVFTDDMYSGDIEWYLENWERVGKFITQLIEFEYDTSVVWSDEEDEHSGT